MTAQVIGQCASHGLDVEGVAIPTRTASGLGWRGPSLIGLAAQHVEVVLRALTGRSWYLTAQLVGQCASLRLQVEGVMASRRAVACMPWRRPALVAQSAQRIRAVLRSLARGSSIRMTIGSLPCGLLTLPIRLLLLPEILWSERIEIIQLHGVFRLEKLIGGDSGLRTH
ncbi:MAG: hypothetical protein JF606_23220 [Burkholderiales bacterium]|nr:hypothetical protein [Burkholderiales bacterium]